MFAILGQRIGPEDAERVVVEFSDFQCPFCASVQPLLEDALRQSDRHLAIAYVHFPLDQIHPHAVAAAVASNCAAAQGRFVAMHNHLFAHQSRIGVEPWQVAATRAGVPDTIAFRKCLSNNRERELVQKQAALGKEIGVRGTPSFIIDGKLYSGIPPSELRRLLLRRTSQN